MSGFLLAVDYGTVNTAAMLRRPDGQVRPVLFDGSPLFPSAACTGPDGHLLVGRDAETAGRVDPTAFVPDPRSRVDVGTVALGSATFPVVDVIAATLDAVCREAVRSAGGARPGLVLTHPASWDGSRRAVLSEAGSRTGLGVPALVPAPVAAAWYQAQSVGDPAPGRHLLVYHLGAGSFEASLVRRTISGYDVVATTGLTDIGGIDLDDLLVRIVGAAVPAHAAPAWQRLVNPTGAAELRRFVHLCDDARAAKEALSRQPTAAMHIPLVDQNVQVSRAAFESAAEPMLARTVEATAGLLASTGTAIDQVDALLLLGGSSRIPLVAVLLRRRLGLAPVSCKQPELAVAEGALSAVARRAGADDRPTRELPVVLPAAAWPTPTQPPAVGVAAPLPRRRGTRLFAMASVVACAAVAATVVYATHPARFATSARGPAPTGTSSAAVDPVPPSGTVGPVGRTRTGSTPGPSQSPSTPADSAPPVSTPPSSPVASSRGTGVSVSVSAAPTTGSCATNFTFVGHLTISDGQRHRWHWVLGGPDNYSSVGGDQSADKTGDVHTARKFTASGTYWAQIQITSPVAVTSNRVTVEVLCAR